MLTLVVVVAGRPWRAASFSCCYPALNLATHYKKSCETFGPPHKCHTPRGEYISTAFMPSNDLPFI